MSATVNNMQAKKPMNKWLVMLLALTFIATVWTAMHDKSPNENESVELVGVGTTNKSRDAVDIHRRKSDSHQATNLKRDVQDNLIPWQKLKRAPLQGKPNDVFKVHSWVVVLPVKKVKPALPPPPVAPPVPFIYMGKLEDTPKGTLVFLMASNKLYSVVKGENVDQLWRLDTEDTNFVHLTYLPLGLTQILSKSARLQQVAEAPMNSVELNP
jgi:hypothetical protein